LVTPVPLSPLLLLCCAYGGGSIKISLQAMPYTYKYTVQPKKRGVKWGINRFISTSYTIAEAF
jgi:hypothetical protein